MVRLINLLSPRVTETAPNAHESVGAVQLVNVFTARLAPELHSGQRACEACQPSLTYYSVGRSRSVYRRTNPV